MAGSPRFVGYSTTALRCPDEENATDDILLTDTNPIQAITLVLTRHDRVAWSAQAIQRPLTSSLLMRCGQIPGVQVPTCDSTHRQQSPLRSIAVHLCATAVRPRLLVCSGRYPPRPAHEGYSRTLSANPCDRVRRSSADAGRAASAQFRPSRSAPRSNAAVPVKETTGRFTWSSRGPTCAPSSTS